MLTMNEDQVVVAWVLFMQEIELSISLQTIKNESGKIDSNKANTFSRTSWWYWFNRRHLELNIHQAKGLDIN
jgi:hypothetical protein